MVDSIQGGPPPTSPVPGAEKPTADKAPSFTELTPTVEDSDIHNFDDLRKLDPDAYNRYLEGIAQNICGQMKSQQDASLQRQKEYNRDSG